MAGTALSSGIERLYHYEKFNPDHLRDTLLNQRVHCSDPLNLNDPWDCRPWFDESVLDDLRALEEFLQWTFSLTPTKPVSEGEVELSGRCASAHACPTNPA